MHRTLVVTANASLARLFARDTSTGVLVPQATLHHAESRIAGHDLADDRPGREAADHGRGLNRFEPRHDVRRQEHEKFAHAIASSLRLRLAAREFEDLWLLASSSFLGELRSALEPAVLATVRLSRATDLTSFDLSAIEERLRALSVEVAAAARSPR